MGQLHGMQEASWQDLSNDMGQINKDPGPMTANADKKVEVREQCKELCVLSFSAALLCNTFPSIRTRHGTVKMYTDMYVCLQEKGPITALQFWPQLLHGQTLL